MKRFQYLRRILLVFILAIGLLGSGFAAGIHFGEDLKPSQAQSFFKGNTSFCDLNEDDKLRVCPIKREALTLAGGSLVLSYTCDSSGLNSFIEIYGDSAKDRQFFFAAMIKLSRMGAVIRKVCKDKKRMVYRISPK